MKDKGIGAFLPLLMRSSVLFENTQKSKIILYELSGGGCFDNFTLNNSLQYVQKSFYKAIPKQTEKSLLMLPNKTFAMQFRKLLIMLEVRNAKLW